MDDNFSKYELLANHLAPRFGDIYALGARWTDELRESTRTYLTHDLPGDVRAWLLDPVAGAPDKSTDAGAVIEKLIHDAQEPLDLGCVVRDAAVSAVPTLELLIGHLKEWPSDDDNQDAVTWLRVHSDQATWNNLATASGHQELLPVVGWLNETHDPTSEDLAAVLTPPELLAAWRQWVCQL